MVWSPKVIILTITTQTKIVRNRESDVVPYASMFCGLKYSERFSLGFFLQVTISLYKKFLIFYDPIEFQSCHKVSVSRCKVEPCDIVEWTRTSTNRLVW